MRIAILDFEATDKEVKTARITQGAVSVYEDKKEIYHHSALVYEESYEEINSTAAAITGITKGQLVEFGVHPKVFLDLLIKVISGCDYVCGHNIRSYDIPLANAEIKRWDTPSYIDDKNTIDTRFDVKYPEHIQTRKLLYLAAEFGYANAMAHSARHDVDATAFLLFRSDLDETIFRSKSPDIIIQAKVSYDTRDLAKERGYGWDGERKIWTKQIKECDLAIEEEKSKFEIVVI